MKTSNMKEKEQKQKKENSLPKKTEKEWTPKDTRRLYPLLSEEEAKMAWEMGW